MAHHVSDLAASDIAAYLAAHEEKSLLRFLTCGSVDDGKSTLIGRLLYESKLVFEDQLDALYNDSRRLGTQGNRPDLALLVDGLASEREQGITIDVAYRFFSTEKRKFIVADTPGHEQYTRNMATGASTADLAIILVDARKGILTQTRRHSFIVSRLGIRNIVVAVNKMDLVDYDPAVFRRIEREYALLARALGEDLDITAIPISALEGDNVIAPSAAMPWYDGPTLMEHLEQVEVEDARAAAPFRLPVQWVNRPDLDFRGFAGQIAGGSVRVGDPVTVLPSGLTSTVTGIVTMDEQRAEAIAGQSVTLTLAHEIDVSRGDMLVASEAPAQTGDRFEATILWMADEKMFPGRSYWIKTAGGTAQATIGAPDHRVDINTLATEPARNLALNEIGVCAVTLDRPIAFDAYADNRDTGSFILIDRLTNATVGMGMIHRALSRSANIHWQATEIDRQARAALKGHRPAVVWFTGLSGSGKSTIANLVEARLAAAQVHTMLLDGDNVRHGLNRDLGFSDTDRVENIRRIAEVARLMTEAGLVTLVSFISPFRAERRMARSLVPDGEFFLVHVDTPLKVAEARDPKGLYAKARAGEIANFTGIGSPYERPEQPDLRIDTTALTAQEAADLVIAELARRGIIAAAGI
ncbi:sulfate adenylyltransferase subunit CysN [Roseitalea porphyridii]|uniref:Multifunctional fusion protein n=1 Tax=Roseitalea porphyridii TaxID=1852022 RepID=A0A4P6V0K4_9HYPH|nr:sulfate adenylyltransferase subunit CysN [Roseitalea porphyridii]QBK30046.1 sulfate adenylyltransferase subunit CysN [Roseitalea porphyridii]